MNDSFNDKRNDNNQKTYDRIGKLFFTQIIFYDIDWKYDIYYVYRCQNKWIAEYWPTKTK